MVDSLKKTLMDLNEITEADADAQIKAAREELMERLGEGDMPFDICEELFGLESDYLEDLIG